MIVRRITRNGKKYRYEISVINSQSNYNKFVSVFHGKSKYAFNGTSFKEHTTEKEIKEWVLSKI